MMRQQGVGLIEVLVSLLVIGIGLLGVVALYTRAQQAEVESYQRAQALILLDDMVNRLNANRSAAGCYAITTDLTSGTPYLGTGNTTTFSCAGVGTSSTRATADADLAAWGGLLAGAAEKLGGVDIGALAGARGCISYDAGDDIYRVSIAWQGLSDTVAPADNCATGLYGSARRRRLVTTSVRLAELD